MVFAMLKHFLLLCATVSAASTKKSSCTPVTGTLTLNLTNLYPESADWDPIHCKLYISALYNDTVIVYDPYTKQHSTLELPDITDKNVGNYTPYHVDGIDYDRRTRSVYIAATSADAFTSTTTGNYSNANFTGPNHILRYNTDSHGLTDIDLTGAQAAFASKMNGNLTNGFQDMAEDSAGNSFAIGSFGNSIVKIPANESSASLWYTQEPYSLVYGFGGIVTVGEKLIVSDSVSRSLVTLEAASSSPKAVYVEPSGLPSDVYSMADGLLAPSKFNGRVLLWSNDYNGTVVFGSEDGWISAKYLGLVPAEESDLAQGGFVTDTFEIGRNIFTVSEFFQLSLPPAKKTSWAFYDITQGVDEIVKSAGMAWAD